MDTLQEKICSKCAILKTLDEFGKNKTHKDGHASACLSCEREVKRVWYYANSEKSKASNKRWAAANLEKSRAIKRKWRRNNLEQGRKWIAAWRAADPERSRAKRRKDYAAHPETERASAIARRAKNPKKANAQNKIWRKNNPKKVAALKQRRKAAEAGVPINDLTNAQFEEIKAAQKQRCAYCGKRRKLTREHVIAVINKGSNTVPNVVAACRSCNSQKHTGPPPIPVQLNLLTVAPQKPYKPSAKKGS